MFTIIDGKKGETELNRDLMNWSEATIFDGNGFIVPYHIEKDLRIQSLAFDIAAENDWCYPDLNKIEVKLIGENINGEIDVFLYISVQPPIFTREDIDGVLINEDIVNAANDFRNGVSFGQNFEIYKL